MWFICFCVALVCFFHVNIEIIFFREQFVLIKDPENVIFQDEPRKLYLQVPEVIDLKNAFYRPKNYNNSAMGPENFKMLHFVKTNESTQI